VIAPPTAAFLEAGSALIVGTVDAAGAPHASRGWGMTVVHAETGQVRLLMDADDAQSATNLAETGAIAITAGDVRTLRSIQLKGQARDRAPATVRDRRWSDHFCELFFTAVHESDGVPRVFLERLRPLELVAWTVHVDELYDQTPGPRAGNAIKGDDG
jgi:hypothetical protein